MARPIIEVTFDKAGQPIIEVKGAKGPGCTEITRPLEEALGVVRERSLKREHGQGAAQQQRTSQ